MSSKHYFKDIVYVSDGHIRRADILVEEEHIAFIDDKEELTADALARPPRQAWAEQRVMLPGVIDDHVHTRQPGLTHKGDLASESHAAAAGGVTTFFDMPNVVPQTTTLQALDERFALGAAHAYVNYSFFFGATNTNADLLPHLDPARVCGVKLFMGSSTGGMLVDRGEALRAVFERSPLLIMAHCEDSDIIARNMKRAVELHGDDPDVRFHPEIRSREACLASSRLAARLARETGARLHIAHVTTQEELDELGTAAAAPGGQPARITLEACVPHLLFDDGDYARLGTRIKCNPAVKSRRDRDALRRGLTDGRIALIGTDHAPHLPAEKRGGCLHAVSGMPMVQFSLVAMLYLVEEGVLPLERLVELMCHAPARLFQIPDRGHIRTGMKADLVVLRRKPWTLTAHDVVSRCGWSPLEGHTFNWQVAETYCNGRLIYDNGTFAEGNAHAQAVRFHRSSR